jgi:hypothetical protein
MKFHSKQLRQRARMVSVGQAGRVGGTHVWVLLLSPSLLHSVGQSLGKHVRNSGHVKYQS